MKSISLIVSLLSNLSYSQALNGNDLLASIELTLDQAIVEVEKSSIIAWKSSVIGDDISTTFLNRHGFKIDFHCHEHNPNEVDCHFEGVSELKSTNESLIETSYIKKAQDAAVIRLSGILERQNKSFSDVKSFTIWASQNDNAGHEGSGTDIWTKFVIQHNSTMKNLHFVCHTHGGHGESEKFACHYSEEAKAETAPSFKKK